MRSLFAALPLTLLAFIAPPAMAQAVPSPRPWLEKKVAEAEKLATKKTPKANKEEAWNNDAKVLIDDMLDWDEMTRRSLGRQWEKLDEKQQNEFAKILREMIETSYRSKLKFASRGKVKKPKKVKLEWLDEKIKKNKATVSVEIKADKQTAVLEFKTLWNGKRWYVYDVAIDDVSTVRTYRSQFRKMIEKEGFDELLNRMRRKITDIREGRAELGP